MVRLSRDNIHLLPNRPGRHLSVSVSLRWKDGTLERSGAVDNVAAFRRIGAHRSELCRASATNVALRYYFVRTEIRHRCSKYQALANLGCSVPAQHGTRRSRDNARTLVRKRILLRHGHDLGSSNPVRHGRRNNTRQAGRCATYCAPDMRHSMNIPDNEFRRILSELQKLAADLSSHQHADETSAERPDEQNLIWLADYGPKGDRLASTARAQVIRSCFNAI